MQERPYTYSTQRQIDLIKCCCSKNGYDDLYKQFFSDYYISTWIETVDLAHQPSKKRENIAQQYQLLGLTAILFAQYGFESMEGQSLRHSKHQWSRFLFHPFHQVAILTYAAQANLQAYTIKQDWQSILEQAQFERPELAWRVFPAIYNGKAKGQIGDTITADMLIKLIQNLIPTRQKDRTDYSHISTIEQMPKLNTALGQIEYTGHQADTISTEKFFAEIYPQFATIILDLLQLDLEAVFTCYRSK